MRISTSLVLALSSSACFGPPHGGGSGEARTYDQEIVNRTDRPICRLWFADALQSDDRFTDGPSEPHHDWRLVLDAKAPADCVAPGASRTITITAHGIHADGLVASEVVGAALPPGGDRVVFTVNAPEKITFQDAKNAIALAELHKATYDIPPVTVEALARHRAAEVAARAAEAEAGERRKRDEAYTAAIDLLGRSTQALKRATPAGTDLDHVAQATDEAHTAVAKAQAGLDRLPKGKAGASDVITLAGKPASPADLERALRDALDAGKAQQAKVAKLVDGAIRRAHLSAPQLAWIHEHGIPLTRLQVSYLRTHGFVVRKGKHGDPSVCWFGMKDASGNMPEVCFLANGDEAVGAAAEYQVVETATGADSGDAASEKPDADAKPEAPAAPPTSDDHAIPFRNDCDHAVKMQIDPDHEGRSIVLPAHSDTVQHVKTDELGLICLVLHGACDLRRSFLEGAEVEIFNHCEDFKTR